MWFTKTKTSRSSNRQVGGNRVRLVLEQLESRYCPSGPTITMSVVQAGHHDVTVTGQVSDPSPSGLTVTLTGVVSGTAVTTTNGSFTYNGTASSLGQINASVTDSMNMTGTGTAQLTNSAPVIVGFRAIDTFIDDIWVFQGTVQDEYAPGLTVTLWGITSLNNVPVTVNSNGTFSLTVQLRNGETGIADAQVTDWWGVASAVVQAPVA